MAEIYKYPTDIGNDRYKYRKVMITVKKQVYLDDSKSAYEDAKKLFNASVDKIKKEATTAVGVKNNIEANINNRFAETVGVIVLPLPNAFSDSQSHGWSRETGIIGTIGQSLTTSTIADAANATGNSTLKSAGNLANKLTGNASVDRILGTISNQTGTRKALIDPGYFQNYTGSDPRSFQMTFDLIPKNADEANSILMILFKLKQWSSPSRQLAGVSLLAPYWFDIELSNPYISSLTKMNKVVLTGMDVDYGADGAMQQTADGMPKHIALSLRFNEAEMTTSDDYNSVPQAQSRN